MSEPFRSVYSVIPASVRYDNELRPNAKLLYGELSALTMAEGYCWASNAYLAELFGLSAHTISGLIRQLQERGHIVVEVERDPGTNEVIRRKIWISGPAGLSVPPPSKNGHTSLQNCGDPPSKNGQENTNSLSNIPPIVPHEGDKPNRKKQRKQSEPKKAPDWKPNRFEDFWKAYPCGQSKQAAIRAWDKLKPDETLLKIMARGLQRAMNSRKWQDGIGIPYASTWLNQRRWEDEPDKSVGTGALPMAGPRAYHMEVRNGEEIVVFDDQT